MSNFLVNPYWFAAAGCTYETDFSSSDGWTTAGSNFTIDTGNSELDFLGERNGNNDAIGYDLTEVSDTEWNLRFKFTVTTVTSTDGGGLITCFGLRSANQSTNVNTNQDAIGFFTFNSNGAGEDDFRGCFADDTYVYANSTEIGTDLLATGIWYIEIKRTSSTVAEVLVTPNSDYSGGDMRTLDVTGITGLRYIVFSNQQGTGSVNQIIGTIKDLKFANGTSEAC
jgi:hypothetical protein|tara:strand:- start:77 stop:751 length:675 start_codon:yes stop_codon:yes gene_type:complete